MRVRFITRIDERKMLVDVRMFVLKDNGEIVFARGYRKPILARECRL